MAQLRVGLGLPTPIGTIERAVRCYQASVVEQRCCNAMLDLMHTRQNAHASETGKRLAIRALGGRISRSPHAKAFRLARFVHHKYVLGILLSAYLIGCSDSRTSCVGADAGTTSRSATNFDRECYPVVRLDVDGKRLDAHEATIEIFEGNYYLYGTSFGCGFVWKAHGTPFCGFRSYKSRDLVEWTDNGFLFDADSERWQRRCACTGDRCGCFRPHVVYNAETQQYVLWFNGNDVPISYHVMVSRTPTGPFEEVDEPQLAVNAHGRIEIPNNGDPSVFVDDDGTAFLSYTDWKKGGDIVIEKLDANYTSGTGEHIRLGMQRVEAPAMFKRNGKYYLLYSDPNCGLCGGTGTSARSSLSPLGEWSPGRKLSDDSCGGQPSHVTRVIDKDGIEHFLFQSDLWDPNGQGDQRKANYYWGPLEFEGSELRNIRCLQSFAVPELGEVHGSTKEH